MEYNKTDCKTILNLEHHMCISFGVSTRFYGRQKNKLAGLGQGNVFSGTFCRDVSYLIINKREEFESD